MKQVVEFANWLSSNGCEVRLRLLHPPSMLEYRLETWTEQEVLGADFVVLICTRSYKIDADRADGSQVKHEVELIKQRLSEKRIYIPFLPVLFSKSTKHDIPACLFSAAHYRYCESSKPEKLLFHVFGKETIELTQGAEYASTAGANTSVMAESECVWDIINGDTSTRTAFFRALAAEGKVIDDLLQSGLIDDLVTESVCTAKSKGREYQIKVLFETVRTNKKLANRSLQFIAVRQPGIVNILHPKCNIYRLILKVDSLHPRIAQTTVQGAFEDFNKTRRPLTLLCIGQAGVGKSALANALGANPVAKTGRGDERITLEVIPIRLEIKFEDVNATSVFYDTPGLTRHKNGPDEFIKMTKEIKKGGKDFDLLIICCSAAAPRDVLEEADMIQSLTEAFGKEIWRRTAIILTQANLIIDLENETTTAEYFHNQGITIKKNFIRGVLSTRAGLTRKEADDVPCVPVGMQARPFLCDGTEWRKEFWLTCLGRVLRNVQGVNNVE